MTDYEMLSVIKAIAMKHGLLVAEDNVVDATEQAIITAATVTQDDVDVEKAKLTELVVEAA